MSLVVFKAAPVAPGPVCRGEAGAQCVERAICLSG